MEKTNIALTATEIQTLKVLLNEDIAANKAKVKKYTIKGEPVHKAIPMMEVWIDDIRKASNLRAKLQLAEKPENFFFVEE